MARRVTFVCLILVAAAIAGGAGESAAMDSIRAVKVCANRARSIVTTVPDWFTPGDCSRLIADSQPPHVDHMSAGDDIRQAAIGCYSAGQLTWLEPAELSYREGLLTRRDGGQRPTPDARNPCGW